MEQVHGPFKRLLPGNFFLKRLYMPLRLRRYEMTAAIFALAGTVLGVLGTLAVELFHARTENLQSRRAALRLACADFTTAVALMRNLH
jgi:hypothetical protein